MLRRGGLVQRRFAEPISDINVSSPFEKQPAAPRVRCGWCSGSSELVACRGIDCEASKPSAADVDVFRRHGLAG
jgi:hypothetical protein